MSFISLKYAGLVIAAAMASYFFRYRLRNIILLGLSYLFYGFFGVQLIPYIAVTTLVTYFLALFAAKSSESKRRFWTAAAVIFNIGVLFVFKYLDFSIGILNGFFSLAGADISFGALRLLMPIGLSFYIFQLTGYSIDVYRGKIPAEKNIIDFALFASFFPGLVSGPIQRAPEMLPQYKKDSVWSYDNVKNGGLLFLWGMFKKMVVADQLAILVNTAYSDLAARSGVQLFVAAAAYTVQIYCDFSAYSDMAIGSAKILGFTLPRNFESPYWALSVRDFWRRWHISLSSWFRDYLYFPLGGSRKGSVRTYLNILAVFIVSGLWHGASMTFVVWGVLHGLFQIVEKMLSPFGKQLRRRLGMGEKNFFLLALRWLVTFVFINVSWIFFRAGTVGDAVYIIRKILSIPFSGLRPPLGLSALGLSVKLLAALIPAVMLIFAADFAWKKHDLVTILGESVFGRYAVCFVLVSIILLLGYYGSGFNPQDFVYFKF